MLAVALSRSDPGDDATPGMTAAAHIDELSVGRTNGVGDRVALGIRPAELLWCGKERIAGGILNVL